MTQPDKHAHYDLSGIRGEDILALDEAKLNRLDTRSTGASLKGYFLPAPRIISLWDDGRQHAMKQ